MAIVYVSKESVKSAINYFTTQNYNSGEQIGLFFVFKSIRFNNREYQGLRNQTQGSEKNKILRVVYDLAGLFDSSCEEGKKRTTLFPFSFSRSIKTTSYYNGGTEFKRILGRIADTADNALIDEGKYLRKNDVEADSYKFAPDYLELLQNNFLNNGKISLGCFSAWFCRFKCFEVENAWLHKSDDEKAAELTRVCKKKTVEELRLTEEELNSLFYDDGFIIKPSETHISGEELRNNLSYENNGSKPEVASTAIATVIENKISVEQFDLLVMPHGKNITAEALLKLLLDSKQAVLTGPPGTGKSFISSKIKSNFDKEYLIQFHPNLSYEQFIGGNTFDENGNVVCKAGVFTEFCMEAAKAENREKKYLFLIDELNRASVSKVFGETIIALDREYKTNLPVPLKLSDGNTTSVFYIPENVYILATMNSADRSIALVDYAIRRRFAFVTFYPNSEVVDYLSDYSDFTRFTIGKLMDEINNKLFAVLGDADLLLGQSYFLPKSAMVGGKIKWTAEVIKTMFNYYILPIIEEYTYGNSRYLSNVVGEKLVARIDNTEEFINELCNMYSL